MFLDHSSVALLVDDFEATVDPPIPLLSEPPNTALSGLAKKGLYWKTAVKGAIYNQEKHIRDLKISGGIGGRWSTEGGIGGGIGGGLLYLKDN